MSNCYLPFEIVIAMPTVFTSQSIRLRFRIVKYLYNLSYYYYETKIYLL